MSTQTNVNLLLFVSLLPLDLSAAMSIDFCQATSRAPSGVESPATSCGQFYDHPLKASITGSGRQLDVSLLNYTYGGALANSPDATVDFSLRRSVSVSRDLLVSGGAGQGSLLFGGFSDHGLFWVGAQAGVGYTDNFTSDFLPSPPHFRFWGAPYGNAITVPFTFGGPFTLSLESEIELWALNPFTQSSLSWEVLQQWDLHLEDIVDSSGTSVLTAQISDSPEASSIALLATCLAGIGIGFIARGRSQKTVINVWPDVGGRI